MRLLASSPSSGEFETLRALYLARGHDGNYVAPVRVKRRFPKRVPVADVVAVLAAESGAYVQTNGSGNYCLTAAGVARSRAHKPRRWISVT